MEPFCSKTDDVGSLFRRSFLSNTTLQQPIFIMSNCRIKNYLSSLIIQQIPIVDLVHNLRAPLSAHDLFQILQALANDVSVSAFGGAIEALHLPALDLCHLEILEACLAANPTIRMIAVQDLSSDMAFYKFCRTIATTGLIRQVEVGTSDRMIHKLVTIVGCNAFGNLLQDADIVIDHLCLKSLRLAHTRVFARGLSRNRHLKVLKLDNVQLEDFSTLLRSLSHVPIELLSLENMEIDVVDDDNLMSNRIDETNPWLHLPNTLQVLSIKECSLCVPEIEALCEGLVVLRNLQKLTMSGNDLLPSAAIPLGRLLSASQSLKHVDFEHNLFGTTGTTDLLSYHGSNKAAKRPLSLKLPSNNIRDLSAAFEKAVCIHQLYHLDLSENPLGSSIIKASEFFIKAVKLKILRLDGCGLTDPEISALCHGLPPSVAELGLANNIIHETGAKAIQGLLENENCAVTSLDLSSCHICDATLCQLLPSSNTGRLRELYLAFNTICNDGMFTISKYLRQPTCRLRRLNLQFNDFDEAGLRHIEMALSERNTSLHYLYFWNNNHELDSALSLGGYGGPITRRIDHWLSLNRAGRIALTMMGTGDQPEGLWTAILAHADRVYGASAVFYLLALMDLDRLIVQ